MNEEALKARLKAIAIEKQTTFNQVWKQLLLERFLARLSSSNHQDKFVFKGGLLLASYINIGRETIDIDFMMRNLHSEEENIKTAILEIVGSPLSDDVNFRWHKFEKLTQPHMPYNGFRVSLHAQFGNMKDNIQIDIGVGDAVTPIEKNYFPFMYKGKPIFTGEITLLVYPVETIFAEKLESIISRGSANSRMKDYHDLLLMIREPNPLIDRTKLYTSLQETFANRTTALELPIFFDQSGMENLQQLWGSHTLGLGPLKKSLKMPDTINEVISEINVYLEFVKLFLVNP